MRGGDLRADSLSDTLVGGFIFQRAFWAVFSFLAA